MQEGTETFGGRVLGYSGCHGKEVKGKKFKDGRTEKKTEVCGDGGRRKGNIAKGMNAQLNWAQA